ncbi:voltage-gated potassium channel subunit beta-3-like isoform X2 [Strigops habroptila]|uniref:Voltage-gated potassium channel subunit beta-3-like n=1 Tax=Strigops habroptila TaxID=2489341 RepID=A0A672U2E9_STRHB|nr:voltage-gated potassium channel subunit beta-3-like isoform X2 [Strigops habroptila]
MKYRTLGRSGLRVSCLGLGTRGTFGEGISDEVLTAAYDSGITLFDVTEASGRAEKLLGNVLKSKGWRRSSYVITTRVFWGGHADRSLSRKQVLEGLCGSLQRLQLDYVDVIFAGPRPGPAHTEELVRVMSDVIDRGLALYWGTAGGAPGDVMDTFAVARQFNLVAPVCQWAELLPEPRLFRQLGLGAVTWSPVAPGPALEEEPLPHGRPIGKAIGRRQPLKVGDLQQLAQRSGCSVSQLGIAWSLRAEGVSSVLVGAETPQMLQEQLQALQVLPNLSPATLQELDTLLGGAVPP